MLYYLRLKDDKHNRRYKVREAVSVKAAVHCIWHAQATGSVGGKDLITEIVGEDRRERVLADVVRVNDDLSEVRPS